MTHLFLTFFATANAQQYNGLNTNSGNLFRTSDAKTRSISPENFTGEKGKGGMAKIGEGAASNEARELGQGWKVSPYINIQPGETFTLAGNRRLRLYPAYLDDAHRQLALLYPTVLLGR